MTEYHEIGTPKSAPPIATDEGFLFWGVENEPGQWIGSVFEYVLRGDVDILKRAINVGWDVATASGLTLMHYAAAGNQLHAITFLLGKMKRPHAPDVAGTGPLALACRFGHVEAANLLVSAGAVVAAVDKRGNTCLHETALWGQRHVVQSLLEMITQERLAALLGHVLWMENGMGFTCYDLAVREEHRETADLILSFMQKTSHVTYAVN